MTGDADAALAISRCADFERAVEADSGSAEAWNNRGATRYVRGDRAGALADFNRALELRPRYAEAANNRGIVRHALGDRAGALADFDLALAIQPRYAEALCNRGGARHAAADLDGAVADFDRAVGIRPDYAEAYHGRASVLQAGRDLDGAVADYDRALRLIPAHAAAPVWHLRGGVRFHQRRFAEAVADYDRALAINPQLCMVYISRGSARYHMRDPAALADYATAFALDGAATAAEVIRLLAADAAEDADAVLKNCRQHIRICPEDVMAYARRGLTLVILGRAAEAAPDLAQVLRRSPEWKERLDLLIETARQCALS
jgi:serine/threonine-protein kinase